MTTILSWVTWYLAIAAILTVGAMAWERSARWSGRPARWGWLIALAGSAALPWLLRLLPESGWTAAVPAALPMVRLDPVVVATAVSGPSGMEIAEAIWLAASMAMVGYFGVLLARVLRMSRRWRVEHIDGEAPVLVSARVGPAVVGVRRSVVVLPEWALELEDELRGLLLRHERSHAAAGDPRLLLIGLVLVAAMPWNPLMWLQLLRLRNAIELDCDARVLGSGADPARYGTLLLEVGRRRSRHAFVMATFAEPRMLLAQRIGRIAQWPPERRHGRAVGYAAAAVLLFGAALSCADPVRITEATRQPQDIVGLPDPPRAPAVADSSKPHFTPMTVAPRLLNREEVSDALVRSYPPLLRDAGIGGSPTVHLFIDEEGSVRGIQLARTSRYAALDTAALAVARLMRFEAALNRDRKVAVWIELPIVFSAKSNSQPPATPVPDAAPPMPAVPDPGTPHFTPMTVAPKLLNSDEIKRAVTREFPPLLREAGVNGNPTVHVFVDVDGRVGGIRVSRTSGYPALDSAGVAVARLMRFEPALNRDRKVAVWVEIPITFTPVTRSDVGGADRLTESRELGIPPRPTTVPRERANLRSPELLNRAEVERVLVQSYPPLLRDAGIGGSPTIHFFIDESGAVKAIEAGKRSGYPALDEAALAVARVMRLSPGEKDGRKTAMWVEIPIVFTAK